MSRGHVLNCGLLCCSPFQCMVGEGLCIYELHKVDKACKSQEERQPGVKRATPGHPGGLRRSHRQAASPCAGLCALSLWAPRGIALCRAVCCLSVGSSWHSPVQGCVLSPCGLLPCGLGSPLPLAERWRWSTSRALPGHV